MAYLGEYDRIKALLAPPAGALGEEGRESSRLRPPRLNTARADSKVAMRPLVLGSRTVPSPKSPIRILAK